MTGPLRAPLAGWLAAAALAGMALAGALGAWAGYRHAAAQGAAERQALARGHAEQRARAAAAALRRLQVAQARSDQLVLQLAAEQRAATQLRTERDHAIRKLTGGRLCFSEPAVRVLNDSPGAAAGQLPAAGSGAAADGGGFATDTDVGLWISGARARYAECKGRLDRLIAWHRGEAP